MFNVGVELGQLMFIAAMMILKIAVSYLPGRNPQWTTQVAAYGIGTVAAFWTIERVVSFWA